MTGQSFYYQLELAAWLSDAGLFCIPIADLHPGDAKSAVEDNLFAELNIPYDTGEVLYNYVFHLFTKLNDEPAIEEMLFLQREIETIHQKYWHLCTRCDLGEPSQRDDPGPWTGFPFDETEEEPASEPDVPDLGPCCVCEKTGPDVCNILALHKLAPIPGRGWGCFQCGLPQNGAVAVVCDGCLEKDLRYACRGYPGQDGRVPIDQLQGDFRHDLARHPESSHPFNPLPKSVDSSQEVSE